MLPRQVAESFLWGFQDSAGPSCSTDESTSSCSTSSCTSSCSTDESPSPSREPNCWSAENHSGGFCVFLRFCPGHQGCAMQRKNFVWLWHFLCAQAWIWNGGQWKSFYKDFLLTVSLKCAHALWMRPCAHTESLSRRCGFILLSHFQIFCSFDMPWE